MTLPPTASVPELGDCLEVRPELGLVAVVRRAWPQGGTVILAKK